MVSPEIGGRLARYVVSPNSWKERYRYVECCNGGLQRQDSCRHVRTDREKANWRLLAQRSCSGELVASALNSQFMPVYLFPSAPTRIAPTTHRWQNAFGHFREPESRFPSRRFRKNLKKGEPEAQLHRQRWKVSSIARRAARPAPYPSGKARD